MALAFSSHCYLGFPRNAKMFISRASVLNGAGSFHHSAAMTQSAPVAGLIPARFLLREIKNPWLVEFVYFGADLCYRGSWRPESGRKTWFLSSQAAEVGAGLNTQWERSRVHLS